MICNPTCRLVVTVAASAAGVLALASRCELPQTRPIPSPRAAQLLAVAEDESAKCEDRVEAFARLGKLREEASVDRITPFLNWRARGPDTKYTFCLEAVLALGEIGSPRALPALKEFDEQGGFTIDGIANRQLMQAIADCGDREMQERIRKLDAEFEAFLLGE